MITGKQRAYLRKLGQALQPIIQIGKEGLSDTVITAIDEALEKREIIKVSILESAMLDTRDTCDNTAKRLLAEPVQAIGNRFVIYRKSSNEKYRKIELPRK
ncbi:MAG: ribosome assembly RNA-binding protein YhbY [Clostridiales bacterium]|nr:ribosome assembly RNA-binding protein YhbY [Clostridiales bacterium]